jgi:hypothetical protein
MNLKTYSTLFWQIYLIFNREEEVGRGWLRSVGPAHGARGRRRRSNGPGGACRSCAHAGSGLHAAVGLRSNCRGRFLPRRTREQRRRELDDDGETGGAVAMYLSTEEGRAHRGAR